MNPDSCGVAQSRGGEASCTAEECTPPDKPKSFLADESGSHRKPSKKSTDPKRSLCYHSKHFKNLPIPGF